MKKIVFISAALLLGCIIQVLGQDKYVSGTVGLSGESNSLAMVKIVVKGTSIATRSGEDGSFSLRVPEHYHTLCFSHIGFKNHYAEIKENGHQECIVKMEPAIIDMVGVTIVYDTLTHQSRSYLTTFKEDKVINILVHTQDYPRAVEGLGASR
jgi:hypothetical protein